MNMLCILSWGVMVLVNRSGRYTSCDVFEGSIYSFAVKYFLPSLLVFVRSGESRRDARQVVAHAGEHDRSVQGSWAADARP